MAGASCSASSDVNLDRMQNRQVRLGLVSQAFADGWYFSSKLDRNCDALG